ncbi:MAG TPA: adenylate/guanylate cyclase domain-containing protein [Haliangium sp.]|nr:adenylate/guanylate cyclase domain-containing protein [Haliangium sp.]
MTRDLRSALAATPGESSTPGGGPADVAPIVDWLIARAVGTFELPALLDELCPRLVAAGLPLVRVNASFSILHPLIRAQSITWWAQQRSLEHDHLPHGRSSNAWNRSPYAYMLASNLDLLRLSTRDEQAVARHPLLAELGALGCSEYLGRAVLFDESRQSGLMMSFATDRPGGFTDAHVASIRRLAMPLALAGKVHVASQVAQTLAFTYLGRDAGSRVLSGQIRRGDGETIHAAVLYSDLRDSTRLADTLPSAEFLDLLGDYFECTAGAVLAHRGEVLALIGDAVLAVFPIGPTSPGAAGDEGAACARAVAAARDAQARRARSNAARATTGKPLIDFGIGLHVGDVAYGNIGVPERLCFTVIGPTANEVARLESLTKTVGHPVLASDRFAREVQLAWQQLGLHELRGARMPRAVFALPVE